ncbi:hypothetical protein BS50DRAFT_174359 [Corynespora cassiicola Philippines]|uniref:Uncharacterized protein n=1 Tax=Corynespora cassiicola Philippines TaxID=1448308 RepID=A0A2T2P5N8_CORCC|nr:hypothetical protein BS50DRAFT_174359 [Corynespora cassiicola Philippines]
MHALYLSSYLASVSYHRHFGPLLGCGGGAMRFQGQLPLSHPKQQAARTGQTHARGAMFRSDMSFWFKIYYQIHFGTLLVQTLQTSKDVASGKKGTPAYDCLARVLPFSCLVQHSKISDLFLIVFATTDACIE